jgi:hypothetical protein
MNETDFKIGEHYENFKGVYEVLSIDGDAMRIHWESGEEVDTTVTQQARIIQNMDRERQRLEENRRRVNKTSTAYGRVFTGLADTDFKSDVTGTTWRSRESLGGAVTANLSGFDFTMDSWSIYRWPTVLWAAREHRQGANVHSWYQAKFIVELNESHMGYGFYIERPKDDETSHAWDRFANWLAADDNDTALCKICTANDLVVFDRKGPKLIAGTVTATVDGWQHVADGGETRYACLLDLCATVPTAEWLDLIIGKHTPKDETVVAGQPISAEIAGVFSELAGIYDSVAIPLSV